MELIPGLLKRLQIRAQFPHEMHAMKVYLLYKYMFNCMQPNFKLYKYVNVLVDSAM
jgi:hypothetical protein